MAGPTRINTPDVPNLVEHQMAGPLKEYLDLLSGFMERELRRRSEDSSALDGVFLQSPNGDVYKISVGNNGVLVSELQSGNIADVDNSPTFTNVAANTLTLSGLLTLNGGQIKFPATQIPSANVNTLDDYEEGSWTPSFAFGGGQVGQTYGTRVGKYVKVGQFVIANFDCTLTAKGSSVGSATISGLPFPNANDGQHGGFSISWYAALAGLTGVPLGFVGVNTSSINLTQSAAASVALVTDANFTNTSRIIGTAIYRAAT